MSYILDAIKKSEQQRQRAEVPSLYMATVSAGVKKQHAFLFYGVAALILICAGIFIGWLRPWQQGNVAGVAEIRNRSVSEANPRHAAPLQPPELDKRSNPGLPPPTSKSPANLFAFPWTSEKSLAQGGSLPVNNGVKDMASNALVQKVPERMLTEPIPSAVENGASLETATVGKPAQEPAIVAIEALPLSIQQELPKLNVSGYAYSNIPKERTVGINDRLLQEGEYLARGLRLERIDPDGLVFSYKKYYFRQSLQ
ncbi:MAG: general secretion pathway protein GspB [Nitrosomonadales bacterium]|nr:general secretion pathway protein GspB [Nitrosomonadales bacterium]